MSASDSRTASFAGLTAILMIGQQLASKAARDTLFLSSHEASELPLVMLAGAGLALVGVLVLSRLQSVIGPRRLVPMLFALSGALFGVEGFFEARFPKEISYIIYLHIALFGTAVVSGFWSVINERFDPHAAKRYISRIAAGATLGGALGGLVAERVASLLGTSALLPVLAGANLLCAVGVMVLGRGSDGSDEESERPRSGLSVLSRSPFLRRVAAVVVLLALMSALLDYALKAEADVLLTEESELATFFSLYYALIGVATFAVQTVATKQTLTRLGIGGTLAVLPVFVLVTGALGAMLTKLWSVVVVRGASTILENSAFRSGYELLYTPVAPRHKRPTKLIIDVAGNRVGDAVGSGAVLLILLFVTAETSVQICIGLAAVVAASALILILRLQQGYVAQLAASLKSGTVVLDEDPNMDATTRATLAETTMALNREKLLAEIAELRQSSPGTLGSIPPEAPHDPEADFLGHPLEAATIPSALPMLDGPHRRQAARALRKAAPKHLGQLTDALFDTELPVEVRKRLPAIIIAASNARAVRSLVEALSDERFEIRYRAGQALASFCAKRPELLPAQESVFDIARRAVGIDRKVWESQRLLEEEEDDELDQALGSVLKDRRDRSLEHVFNVLSLALDRDALRLALQALTSQQRELRGTALEYLENVLPEDIRDGLWPYIANDGSARKRTRPREEIVDDLLRSMQSLNIDRDVLLRKIRERS